MITLQISTATTEQAFSAMNIIKNRLRNKMEDDFLMDSMNLYIEKEIAAKFGTKSIIDDFQDLKDRRFHFDKCVEMFKKHLFYMLYFVDIFIISNV